uniref:Uncharacterized protein n=1 Tax=Anguilla anguilla TaxID=7936 RepID=A0A0E9PCZ6_ANGAN
MENHYSGCDPNPASYEATAPPTAPPCLLQNLIFHKYFDQSESTCGLYSFAVYSKAHKMVAE